MTVIYITDFKQHSNFKSLKEYNNNNNKFLAEHKKDLTPTEYIAFKRFIKMACNTKKGVYGVNFASINRIVEYVSKFDLKETGISRSTVKRMLSKLVKFGLIERKKRTGKNGRQTSNLYIFKKFGVRAEPVEAVSNSDTIEPPRTEGEQSQSASNQQKDFRHLNHLNTDINSINTNINYKHIRNKNRFDASYIQDKNFNNFISEIKTFYDDADIIREYIKATKQQTRRYKKVVYDSYSNSGTFFNSDLAEVKIFLTDKIEQMAISAFKQAIYTVRNRKHQKNRIINPIGLYVSILKPMVRKASLEDRYNSVYYDWLSDSEELNVMGVY